MRLNAAAVKMIIAFSVWKKKIILSRMFQGYVRNLAVEFLILTGSFKSLLRKVSFYR